MKRKVGRPKIEIDQRQFENLCGLHCTEEEIAGHFACSPDTIQRWCERTYGENFAETYKKYSALGNISLRRYQFEHAKKNATMAIWLGKQYLGQKDVIEADFNPESLTKAYELLGDIPSVID